MFSNVLNEVADFLLEDIDNSELYGVMIAEKENMTVVYCNKAAEEYFESNDLLGQYIGAILNQDIILNADKDISERYTLDNGKVLNIIVRQNENYILMFAEDISEFVSIEDKNKYLTMLNQQLKDIYEVYNYDTMCITDEKGIVEFSGEACERHCGITHQEIIGMSMYELEKDKAFYPSVTVKVIESHEPEIVIQNTDIGVTLCTVGVPVFDKDGNLHKVISISRDFSREIEIGELMIDLEMKNDYDEECHDNDQMITCSDTVIELMDKMKRAAKTNSTILLEGETGTGKTRFANYIHNMSDRASNPFISVNCGAIPENLIESELFGYEQGAFTGADKNGKPGLIEMAQGGTVFFDEIGELPLQQQVKLLHVLQERSIIRVGGRKPIKLDVRVIAATNKNLQEMVEERKFREDLYYRLNVISFNIPKLSERSEDIPLLTTHFMNKYNSENHTSKEITERAIQYLKEYDWPGNIRELENLIEMICVITSGDKIDVKHLPPKVFNGNIPDEVKDNSIIVKDILTIKEATQEVEKQLIRLSMEQCGENHQQISELLGVDRSTITRKINAYGLKKQ